MKNDRDILAEALAQMRNESAGTQPPQPVVEETLRCLADAQPGPADIPEKDPNRIRLAMMLTRFSLAAAALIAVGYVIGRVSGPRPVDLDELRQSLTPSVAAAVEPALRARLVEDMHQRYQVALAATYVKVKEELTDQYHDDLNRFAVQFLAASNAATNRLLTELVESIDTAQTQDLSRIARTLYQIEQNRIQDKAQLAAGLKTLASRTEVELSQTRREFAQLLGYQAEEFNVQPAPRIRIPNERNEP